MRRSTAISILLVFCLWTGLARAQSGATAARPFVYRLKIAGCAFTPTDRRQTGFRVQGVTGIVTALHGVADCTTVDAVTDEGEVFSELVITAVDVAHDVALLSSQELDGLTTDGFVVSPLATDELLAATVEIVGYPLGLDKQDSDRIERVRDLEPLDKIIPDAEEPPAFAERRSPQLDIPVFNLQAQLLPGHSGAPLLDQQGQVIGVGNGGLRGGTVNRSWAIPWRAIQWQPATIEPMQKELERLAHTDPGFALSFSSTYPTIIEPTEQQKSFSGRVINSYQEPVEGAEVTLSLENGYQVDYTDSAGYYEFSVRNDDIELLREILIEKAGYGKKSQKVFDTLPDKILMDEVALPKPIALEPEQYVLLTFALPLKREPAMSGLLVDQLSEGEVVQILDGPDTEGENVWWQVEHLRSERTGWIRASDNKNIFVAPLPQLFMDDYVEMIAQARRPLYTALNNRKTAAAMVLPGETLVIRSGPEAVDGYVWYEVTRESDGVIGWLAFAGYGNIFLELLPAPPATNTPTPPPTFTATPVPPPTPTDTVTPTPSAATFRIGDFVEAAPSLRIRAFPGLRHEIRESIKQKELFVVTEGPVTADNYTWWKLSELNGAVRGWAAYFESDDDFTLVLAPYQTPTPSPDNQTAHSPPTGTTPQSTPAKAAATTIEILDPKWADSRQGWQTVRWRYKGELKPGQGFDLILWYVLDQKRKPGLTDARLIAEKLQRHSNGEYSVLVNFSAAEAVKQYCDAKYLLTVTVIELDPYKRIGPESAGVQIQVAPLPGGPC